MADGEDDESRNKPHNCHAQMHGRVGTRLPVAVLLQPWLNVTTVYRLAVSQGANVNTDRTRPGSWQAPFWRVLIEWSVADRCDPTWATSPGPWQAAVICGGAGGDEYVGKSTVTVHVSALTASGSVTALGCLCTSTCSTRLPSPSFTLSPFQRTVARTNALSSI